MLAKVCLLRHATARKNLEGRHGGTGTALTAAAPAELTPVVARLGLIRPRLGQLLSSPRPQCIQTAEILSSQLQLPWTSNLDLKPLHLGVLDDLTDTEAATLHPAVASRMDNWRRGLSEISDLNIPDAEDVAAFYSRGLCFLNALPTHSTSTLIVGTRSILVLLASIMYGRTLRVGGGYREIPWPPVGLLVFERLSDALYRTCESDSTLTELLQPKEAEPIPTSPPAARREQHWRRP